MSSVADLAAAADLAAVEDPKAADLAAVEDLAAEVGRSREVAVDLPAADSGDDPEGRGVDSILVLS